MFCGWSGPMAPVNRLAFLEDFGRERVEQAEMEAKKRVADNEKQYLSSNHNHHRQQADEMGNSTPSAGAFVWAVYSGLKCDDGRGIYGEIETAATYEDVKIHRNLCQVVKVYEVSADEFKNIHYADNLVHDVTAAGEKFPGGCATDDAELIDLFDNTRFWYTVTAAVVCPELGRWYLIDSEGYSYPRYCLMPENWREMYADDVQKAIDEKAARVAEEARKAEEERNARREAYLLRCAKWEPLMIDIRPLEETATKTEYTSPEYKKAHRKLNDARRGNICTMIRTAWPGLKFSVRKNDGWGEDYTVTYTDGPTKKQFCAAVDLDLFCAASDEFDGMTDSSYIERREFVDFANKYMCLFTGGEIKVEREQSPENRDKMHGQFSEALPELPNDLKEWNKEHHYTYEEAQKLAAAWGCDADELWHALMDSYCCASVILIGFRLTNFYTAPDTTPTDPKPRKRTTTDSDSDEAPAEGLELVEIADGLAVVGDSRATYTNRKAIKAHGAKWNKAAQQWQAITPEACAALRGWFALNDTTDTPTEAEPLPEPPAAVIIDETPASQKAEDKPASQKTAPAEGQPDADELFMLAAFYMPEGVTAEDMKTAAHGAILNPSDTAAEQLKAEAVRTAAAMMHRADEIRTGCNSMREQNNNPDFNAVDVNSDDYLNAWDECNTQIETFEDYADDIENIALCIAIAAGLSIEEADGLAATYKPEQDDPAQMAITFDSPAPVAPVTDAEVMKTAARIRANYEALKAEAAAVTPSNEKTDEKPASQKLPRIWAGKIDETKKMQFVYAVKIEPNGTQKEQQIIFYGTKKGALNWIADTMHEAREWQSEGRGTNQWYMVDWRQPQNLKYIVRLQEFEARPQMKLIESWNPDSLTDYEKELLAKRQEEEAQIKAEIERAKMLDAIGYPFRGKNADGSFNIPTVDESLYWEYAAGLITLQDAAREFCKCGWTNFVDEDYTRKQFERLNNRWHKLPTLEAA